MWENIRRQLGFDTKVWPNGNGTVPLHSTLQKWLDAAVKEHLSEEPQN